MNVIELNRPKDETKTRRLWQEFTNLPYDLDDTFKHDTLKGAYWIRN